MYRLAAYNVKTGDHQPIVGQWTAWDAVRHEQATWTAELNQRAWSHDRPGNWIVIIIGG